MPVVRELINRISFKIAPGDKANAEKAFSTMKSGAKGVIAAVAGITAAGTKLFADFEKDTGASRFFARNTEEAELLLETLDKIAEKSDTTSRREARRAAKTLQQTRLTKEQLQEFVPLLEKISIARPDLDFAQVAESFRDVISGGDLQQLIEIIPGFKDTAELLSKTTFGKPFGDITDIQRGEIVLDALFKKRTRLNELVAEQQETLVFQMEGLSKEASDFTLNFGEETAPAMTELLKEVRMTIKELNDSESFWTTVKSTIEGITELLRGTKLISRGFGALFSGDFDELKKIREEGQKGQVEQIGPLQLFKNIIDPTKDFRGRPLEGSKNDITINGKITVVNESGTEITDMSADITQQVMSELGLTLKQITATNGGIVPAG
jgi:hypothetical protein